MNTVLRNKSLENGTILKKRIKIIDFSLNALPICQFGKCLYVMVRRLPNSLVGECSGCFRHLCMFMNAFVHHSGNFFYWKSTIGTTKAAIEVSNDMYCLQNK